MPKARTSHQQEHDRTEITITLAKRSVDLFARGDSSLQSQKKLSLEARFESTGGEKC